ncbi:MAG: DUF4142 domain-containing protein [Cyclobacteriaceae bacterium]
MKNTFFVYIFLLFLAILLLTSCESTTSDTSTTSDIEADQDTVVVGETDKAVAEPVDLILLVYMDNRMQYYMGEMAQQQASSEAVRNYADLVMEQGNEIRVKLEDIAQATNTQMPEVMKAESKAVLDSMSQLPSDEFDKAYLRKAMHEYDENIERLNELISKGDNPMVEGAASDIIDIQQAHMERAAKVLEEIS